MSHSKRDEALRRRAEDLLSHVPSDEAGSDELRRVIHELQVHEVELTLQNEALRDTQLQLERARVEYLALYEHAPVGYVTCAPNGRIIQANHAAGRLLGVPAEQLLGTPLPRFAAPGSEDAFHLHSVGAREEGAASCELQLVTADDEVRDVRLVSRTRANVDDAEDELWVCLIDRTEVRRANALRATEQARLSKLEALGVLAGGIAHDFNNLLATINTNLSIARSTPADADEVLAEAESAVGRGAALARQLLTLASGRAPARVATSLGELLEETARFSLRGSGMDLHLDVAPDLWPVELNAAQLSQVVQNLLLNAKDASPAPGPIRITARNLQLNDDERPQLEAGPYVHVVVEDHGSGIAEEDLPRIFDPYFTTKDTGSGLGLAVAHSIAHAHGGLLSVTSRLGAGTQMHLHMPAAPSSIVPDRDELPDGPIAEAGGRVLVMDDEPALRVAYRRLLSHSGHDVVTAADGAEAVELYRAAQEAGEPFDVVILDLTVPGGMGGVEAVAALRAIDPHVRAVAVSGYAVGQAMSAPGSLGFVSALEKPFAARELSRVIGVLVHSSRFGDGEDPQS